MRFPLSQPDSKEERDGETPDPAVSSEIADADASREGPEGTPAPERQEAKEMKVLHYERSPGVWIDKVVIE